MTSDDLTMAIGLSINEIDVLWMALSGDTIAPSDELIRRRLISRLADVRTGLLRHAERLRVEAEERERDRAARGI